MICCLPRPCTLSRLALPLLLCATVGGCFAIRGQRYRHFITPTPLAPGNTLVLGFLGGRESWDNDQRSVRKLGLRLRQMNLPGVHVETVENRKRNLALQLVHRSFDRDGDGALSSHERAAARLVLFGQSFGGAAVVKLARQLHQLDVPVMLTVQIDSVGRNDAVIPPNVARAANLYQDNGLLIRGEPEIRAQDPTRTEILGNWRYDYSRRKVDLSLVPWYKTLFREAHAKMEHDPEVWSRVEELILREMR